MMKSIFIFRRDLRLYDNTTLIYADKNSENIIPIFIFDPHQIETKNASNNCKQFLVESIMDLKRQLSVVNSQLYTYYGKPWEILKMLSEKMEIDTIYFNSDYTMYSKIRDNKIKMMCERIGIKVISFEDCMLNNVDTIKTTTGKHYEKFTPYYEEARKYAIREPVRYHYKNLVRRFKTPIKQFTAYETLYEVNKNIYLHGGRENAKKILRRIKFFLNYNDNKNEPKYDTTLLSAHNKFGTISIREEYNIFRRELTKNNDLIRQLYWRDFYYTQMHYNKEYYEMSVGKYSKLRWDNNKILFGKWKKGQTGIPIVDAGMVQLRMTGWIHNRVRMIVATMLTKIFQIDWRNGERYFQKYLIDYDVTQNIMNWYWISGEVPFANPYFRILNPVTQMKKHDGECEYSKKYTKLCEIRPIVDIDRSMKVSVMKYRK